MSENNIPFTSHIESRVLVAILEDLKLATKPFVGERIFLREYGYSVVVESVNNNKIEGYSVILEDDATEIISGMFPLKVLYDVTPEDPFQVGESITVKLSNFRTSVNGESSRIYRITVNGVDITNTRELTINLTQTTVLSIIVESKGFITYIEREVSFIHPTYIFFSADKSLRSASSDAVRFDNEGALEVLRKTINNSINERYLYIISGYRPVSVKTGDLVEFAIEGKVYYDDGVKVVWRSDIPLNSGQWILTVK